MTVQVRNNKIDKALKVLKRLHADKLYEIKDSRQEYEKPCQKKRKKKKAAIQREKRRILDSQPPERRY